MHRNKFEIFTLPVIIIIVIIIILMNTINKYYVMLLIQSVNRRTFLPPQKNIYTIKKNILIKTILKFLIKYLIAKK